MPSAKNQEKLKKQTSNVPEINYEQLVVDCYITTKHPQGSIGCQAFARGAEWYRSIVLLKGAHAQKEPMMFSEKSMTLVEFDLIARLLRSKEPAISAVRLVVFEKVNNAEAARRVGMTPQAVHRSTKRFLALHEDISKVFKMTIA